MISRILSCRRGATGVEAAILWPILIVMVIGIMEFAMLFFTYGAMQAAAREVTRRLALNVAAPAQAAEEIDSRMPGWAAGAIVEVTQSAPSDPATNVIGVVVTLSAAEATPVRLFTRAADPFQLRAEVVMKQEMPL